MHSFSFFSAVDLLTDQDPPPSEPPLLSVTRATLSFIVQSLPRCQPHTPPPQVVMEIISPVTFLFQMYPGYHQAYVHEMLDHVFAVMAIADPAPDAVPPALRNVYSDFRMVQVKLLTFLTYLHRQYGEKIREQKQLLCAA